MKCAARSQRTSAESVRSGLREAAGKVVAAKEGELRETIEYGWRIEDVDEIAPTVREKIKHECRISASTKEKCSKGVEDSDEDISHQVFDPSPAANKQLRVSKSTIDIFPVHSARFVFSSFRGSPAIGSTGKGADNSETASHEMISWGISHSSKRGMSFGACTDTLISESMDAE
ncbi:hypothetical protein AAVH_19146, partial [Aphelenchoides avenae]